MVQGTLLSPPVGSHRSPHAASHTPVFRLLNYSQPWKPASRPLSRAAPLPRAAVTPQGLGTVVSGRNLGELLLAQQSGPGEPGGGTDSGKSQVLFKLSETEETALLAVHMARLRAETPGPLAQEPPPVAPLARLWTWVASSLSHQRDRASLVLLPESQRQTRDFRRLGGAGA